MLVLLGLLVLLLMLLVLLLPQLVSQMANQHGPGAGSAGFLILSRACWQKCGLAIVREQDLARVRISDCQRTGPLIQKM